MTEKRPETTQPFQEAWQEVRKTLDRLPNLTEEFLQNPADPSVGMTPREVVWKRGKFRLFRYPSQKMPTSPVPYFIVPWLGLSRSFVLDLLPGNSFIEFLVTHGHEVYLLDWGEIDDEDKDIGFEDVVFKYIPKTIERILEVSKAKEVNLNGVCMGGMFTASYLALNPDAPVKNAIFTVSPIDLEHGGLFKTWLDERYFPMDQIIRSGSFSASQVGLGFKMLRPTGDLQAKTGLWLNMERKEYITMYKALNRWANEYIGMPARLTVQLVRELYSRNKLAKGEFALNGRHVDLSVIKLPVLTVAASQDHIVPPLSAKGLMDLISSQDKEYVELPGGHISVFAGRGAHRGLWPKVHEWVTQRSN